MDVYSLDDIGEPPLLSNAVEGSLVPRPSPALVFDRLQYGKTEPEVFAYCKRSKTGAGEGLGTRLVEGLL